MGASAKCSGKKDEVQNMETLINLPVKSVKRETKPRGKLRSWFKKYFWEGQKLGHEVMETAQSPMLMQWEELLMSKYRRIIATFLPGVVLHIIWWCLAIRNNFFALFPANYFMSVTMIFGATVAGMTSEGGGAVAFPVMTLGFNITPEIARDFSLMIQSFGMTSASFTILCMGIHIEWHSLIYCSLGGAFGVIFGLEYVEGLISSDWKKMTFVGIWTSFAVALFILNREKKRHTYYWIQNMNFWKIGVLFASGFIGGIFTSFAGSGLDICSFSVLTLLFLVTEKVTTPTSVILMAVNTCIGFFWRQMMQGGIPTEAWNYLIVAMPVVVVCAPLGSLVASHFHRQVLASLVYILEIMAFISGFAVIKPDTLLGSVTVGIVIVGAGVFYALSVLGKKLHGFKRSAGSQTMISSLFTSVSSKSMAKLITPNGSNNASPPSSVTGSGDCQEKPEKFSLELKLEDD